MSKNVNKADKKKNIIKYFVVGILAFSMVFSAFALLISAIQNIHLTEKNWKKSSKRCNIYCRADMNYCVWI